MAFNVTSVSENSGKERPQVDYDALNKYVVETCQLQQPEVLVGVVSQVIDLGEQKLQDGEMEFTGTPEQEAEILEKKPNNYFKTKDGKRYQCYPQNPRQCVTLAIDFPDIQLAKGKFFGDDSGETKPLRMYLGGQYLIDGSMVVAQPIPFKLTKNDDGKWTFNSKHTLYKMSVASKLIETGGVFLPQDIDKLLGKAFQFQVQIFFKPSKKDPSKSYYTENIKFVGGLGRGQVAPSVDVTQGLVQFTEENDEQVLKELRSHVRNTIKQALNFKGSKIEEQFNKLFTGGNSSSVASNNKPSTQDTSDQDDQSDDFDFPTGDDEFLDEQIPF